MLVPASVSLPAADLLRWYDRHRRAMPWRAMPGEPPDPYHVWLSEIMLQQTTVAAVIPYFNRFLAMFPTLSALAQADSAQVMAAWSGLGYYARARNLHRCAQLAAQAGGFPRDPGGLRSLPGIGAYTAAAIASIAFGVPVVPVDGNVERITSRLFAIAAPLPGSRRAITAAAARLNADPAAGARAADFTQALFDLGATICTPKNPACALCPWREGCAAHRAGIQHELPRKSPKPARPVRYGVHFHLTDAQDRLLLRRRPPHGLFGAMAELPGTAWRDTPWAEPEAIAAAPVPADWRRCGTVRHGLTHFVLRIDVYAARAALPPLRENEFARPAADLAHEALPTVMRRCVALVKSAE